VGKLGGCCADQNEQEESSMLIAFVVRFSGMVASALPRIRFKRRA
jgi:hypothetical protein